MGRDVSLCTQRLKIGFGFWRTYRIGLGWFRVHRQLPDIQLCLVDKQGTMMSNPAAGIGDGSTFALPEASHALRAQLLCCKDAVIHFGV